MKKIARNDWKRHSAPHELTFEQPEQSSSSGDVFHHEAAAFTESNDRKRTNTIGRVRKNTVPTQIIVSENVIELSTDHYTPGVLKIFGETVLPSVQYKSVLASCRSTALELVKQALERFGLPSQNYKKFVLCDVVGRYDGEKGINTDVSETVKPSKWTRINTRMLSDKDKPLLLQKFWKPLDGYSRRYELHERAQLIDLAEPDDTSGLNTNARKILMSKLRPGAIPFFDPTKSSVHTNGLNNQFPKVMKPDFSSKMSETDGSSIESSKGTCNCKSKPCADDKTTSIPIKYPFFLNIRGYDITKDKIMYPVKYKKFSLGNPSVRHQLPLNDVPKISLWAPDIEGTHCCFKVYKYKRTNGMQNSEMDKYNYFLELEPLGANVRINGHKISGKSIVKSGDLLNIGIYYVFVFKDCSKNSDIPLALPWLPVGELDPERPTNEHVNDEQKLRLFGDDENKSSTDESMEIVAPERTCFSYKPEKEEEMVKYICAIIQQQNTQRTYPLTVAFLFSMCIEHACRKFDRRQLKHLFLRILFTTRENVAETAKSLSASKFSCTLLDATNQNTEKDQQLERLLLWISNCVQLLLFLKHTFQLPEFTSVDLWPGRKASEKSPRTETNLKQGKVSSPRKEDSAKHAMGQLVTGLEEITMFCFQQSVYTITKALHPSLSALLDSNPFSDVNSEQCSMEDITRMYGTLAEVTHSVMLHEGITRQLFTYLFFFTSTNVFNKLIADESSTQYYNWSSGVRIRANLSQLEDWATQNGLEDEFGQMFERLLAASELLATSKNTLIKYEWSMMKDHFQPLSAGQIHHILTHYHLGTKERPSLWLPSEEEAVEIENEDSFKLSLCSHPPFALPDNCSIIDLMRIPEEPSFWNHLRRLRALYGVSEDDSDSGFSRSNTPQGTDPNPNDDQNDNVSDTLTTQENSVASTQRVTQLEPIYSQHIGKHVEPGMNSVVDNQRSRIPVKKSNTNPWTLKMPKSRTAICKCATLPRADLHSQDSYDHTEKYGIQNQLMDSVISDLMLEEGRENLDSEDRYKEPKTKVIDEIKANSKYNNSDHSERICQPGIKTLNRSNGFRSNVSNCSARNVKPYVRERSNTFGNEKELRSCLKQKNTVQSISMENVNLPFMFRKPVLSASFYEAIERGYESDTRHRNNIHSQTEQLGSISEQKVQKVCRVSNDRRGSEQKSSPKRTLSQPDFFTGHELERQQTTESLLSDDVFIEESLDNFYRKSIQENDINDRVSFLPNSNSFKPISTSSMDKMRNTSQSQKLMAISFDTGSHSPAIELAQNTLYINGVNEGFGNTSDQPKLTRENVQKHELLPDGILVEVNDATLASRKRHGSSINVVPGSPRCFAKQDLKLANYNPNANSKMSPCPLFTVYLRKTENGLGLGLIDGLRTPLRLTGIFIKKILPNSPAATNGCLQVGDRILSVNGTSVIGANYQSTMKLIRGAEDALTLLVARGNESMARKISSSNV